MEGIKGLGDQLSTAATDTFHSAVGGVEGVVSPI